jgi:tryptophan halogenase
MPFVLLLAAHSSLSFFKSFFFFQVGFLSLVFQRLFSFFFSWLEYATQNGVKQILDNISDVKLAEDGSIASVTTKEHGDIKGRFVHRLIHGFRGLLLNKALGEPFVRLPNLSYATALSPCNSQETMPRRVLIHIRRRLPKCRMGLEYTSRWKRWNGYVYSSAFTSQENAEAEFRATLGKHVRHC